MTNHESSQSHAQRRAAVKSALRAILSFGVFFLASAATAQTPSVETDAAYVQGADISNIAGVPILTIGCADGGRAETPAEPTRTIGDFIADDRPDSAPILSLPPT